MALYPLPPSSNESVIDNGRNVWQMALNAESGVQQKASFTTHVFSFSFSACPKAGGRCRSTWCRTGVSAYQRLHVPLNLAFESTIDICDSDLEIGKRLVTLLFFLRFDSASTAARMRIFFFFFAVDRTTNRVQPPAPPPPPMWKFFRLSATCEILRWLITLVRFSHFFYLNALHTQWLNALHTQCFWVV